jgi:hypothetical protein
VKAESCGLSIHVCGVPCWRVETVSGLPQVLAWSDAGVSRQSRLFQVLAVLRPLALRSDLGFLKYWRA